MIDAKILEKLKPGARVKITERVLVDLNAEDIKGAKMATKKKEEKKSTKERLSTFEGVVLARKHGKEAGATITVRATVAGIGMEKVYPIHSTLITKVDVLSSPKKVHRAKLYYLRDVSAKKIRQKLGV